MKAHAFLQLLLWITLAVPVAAIAGSHEPIDPEKAFRLSARAIDTRTVAVEFEIAGGHYMYRDRFKFAGASGTPIGRTGASKSEYVTPQRDDVGSP